MSRPRKLTGSDKERVQINMRIDLDFRTNLDKVRDFYFQKTGIYLCYSDVIRLCVKHELNSFANNSRILDLI